MRNQPSVTQYLSLFSNIYFKLFLMSLCWSGTFIAGKYLGGRVIPLHSSLIRYIMAFILLGVWISYLNISLRYSFRQHIGFFIQGLTGVLLYNVMFFAALEVLPANRVALIVTSNPAFISIFTVLLFKEKSGLIKWLGILLCLCGVVIIISNGQLFQIFAGGLLWGDMLALIGLLSWTAYSLIGKKLLYKVNSIHAVFFSVLYGTLALALVGFFNSDMSLLFTYGWDVYLVMAYLGAFGTVLAFVWFNDGISKLGALRASGFINLVPVFVVILSYLFLGEKLSSSSFIGGSLVVIGMVLVNGLYKLIKYQVPTKS